MPDAREYEVQFEAAEAAASAGDFARAEALLREGLRGQEAALGPTHADLASTLNNLAVVCESRGGLDDAERFYRRAVAIARAACAADDPLVTTSQANLRDFCHAQGRPYEDAAATPVAPAPVPAPAPAPPQGRPAAPDAAAGSAPGAAAAEPPPTARPAPSARPSPTVEPSRQAPAVEPARSTPAGDPARAPRPARASTGPPAAARAAAPAVPAVAPRGLVAALVVVAVLATAGVGWLWLGPSRNDATPPTEASRGPDAGAAPGAATDRAESASSGPVATPRASAEPAASPTAPASEAKATPAPPAANAPAPARAAATGATTAVDGLRVVAADVCASLETSGQAWRCAPLPDSPRPARVAFYTRIASPRGVRVRHRWSVDGQVRQDVSLSVGASPTEGYRTFSRQTVTPGHWTVALVTAGGTVLHEAAFDVR